MLNEKQGYMRDKMKKWFAAWCGLTAACAMTTSCSMMQDDLDDCPTGLYLSFKYDYMRFAESPSKVLILP